MEIIDCNLFFILFFFGFYIVGGSQLYETVQSRYYFGITVCSSLPHLFFFFSLFFSKLRCIWSYLGSVNVIFQLVFHILKRYFN